MSEVVMNDMELLYVWIEDFKNLKDIGINFSGQFNFKFDQNNRKLIISKKATEELLPENFWGDQIKNITGIIGENGAGKTTILHFLNSFIGNYYCKAIIAFRVRETGKADTIQIFKHSKLQVEEINHTELSILPYEQFSSNSESKKMDLLREINVIYFSNAFGVRAFWPNKNQLDISTGFILENLNQKQGIIRQLSLMDSFKLTELKKQIAFLDQFASEFEIHFGNRLNRVGGYYKDMAGAEINKVLTDMHLNKEFHNILKKSFDPESNTTWYLVKDPIFFKIYLGTMIIVYSGNSLGFSFDNDNLTEVIIKIENRLIQLNLLNELAFFRFLIQLNSDDYEVRVNINEQYLFVDPFSFQFEISRRKFNEFFRLYESTLNEKDYLGFTWNLSSGENAYLNIFSRVHNLVVSNKINKNYPTWLLIDEGELYLHPQWQKSFLNNMIFFMSKIFEGIKFQIILTSHSPLIISDFPKQTLVFIERNASGGCQISNLKTHESTFAANIYELYKDSFFLQGSFFGEYAEKQINLVIDHIFRNNNVQVKTPEEVEKMKFILKSIGDDILRDKLIDTWNKKEPDNYIK